MTLPVQGLGWSRGLGRRAACRWTGPGHPWAFVAPEIFSLEHATQWVHARTHGKKKTGLAFRPAQSGNLTRAGAEAVGVAYAQVVARRHLAA